VIRNSLRLAASLAFLAAPALAQDAGADLTAKGRYLATASDCAACHTAPGGKDMAGGLAIASPVGDIIASNITPSKTDGIGNYTEAQFARALREGIAADGSNLYPAMPYTAYANLSDADIHALYTYFMQGVAPVDAKPAETHLPWPMNIRPLMKIWNLLFLKSAPLAADASQSAEWNRGRYLVEGPAHCSTCHTPRGIMMQEIGSKALSGAQVGAWFAPNITSDKTAGIGSWSQDDIVTYLKTGKLGQAQAAGSMAEAVTHSFSHLDDADLKAIATYIATVPAVADAAAQDRFTRGKAGDQLASYRGKGYSNGMTGDSEGAQIYASSCASCHGVDGQGSRDGYYPALFHNSATGGATATNLIAAVLNGVDRETPDGHVFMPPFGDKTNALNHLDDDQVAALGTYVMAQFGNPDVKVTAQDVATIRAGGPGSDIVLLARIGMIAGGVVGLIIILALLAWALRRKPAGKA